MIAVCQSVPETQISRTLSEGTPAVEDYDRLRFLHFVLDSCCALTESAEEGLRVGCRKVALSAFRQAEEAFHEAQDCLGRIQREDWRADAELMLEESGLRLDKVWMTFMNEGMR
jgi:hypothetical protein